MDEDGTDVAVQRDRIMSTYGPSHPKLTPSLAQKIVDVAFALEIDPLALANAIRAESRFDHQAANANSSARGLIQFTDKTARDTLGTTNQELLAMTPEKQMDYVYRYLAQFKDRLKASKNLPADVQMAIFYPNAIGKPDDFDILDDYHRVSYRTARREGKSPEEARRFADSMWVKYKKGNPDIRTRGDYLRILGMKRNQAADRFDFAEAAPTPKMPLPIRKEMDFTEDRYYMFPGVWQAMFIATGLNEVNRMLLSETPIVRTPLERAGVGENYFSIEREDGRITQVPYPNTRAGLKIWAQTVLGIQAAEVARTGAARADEPRTKSTTTRPPK